MAAWEVEIRFSMEDFLLEENCRRGRKIILVMVNEEGRGQSGVLGRVPLTV